MGKITLIGVTGSTNIDQHIMHTTAEENCQSLLLSVISKTDRFELNASNTIYRAEGNANLVLSMPDTKRVVRLRKSLLDDANSIFSKQDQLDEDASFDLKRTIDYIKFLSLLVGDCYAIPPEMVSLEIHDYGLLNNWLKQFRPADRLEKIIKCQNGTLYPDVTFLPDELMDAQKALHQEIVKTTMKTYCIEIKPKQGWLLDRDQSGEIYQRLEYDDPVKCRYCLLQYYKLEKGVINRISKYCPVDLFSGNPYRMVRTLKGLAKSPQNNFRFFENGNIIYDEHCDKKLLYSCLSKLFGHQRTNQENLNLFVNIVRETLLKDYTVDDSSNQRQVYRLRKNKRKKKVHVHLKRCDRDNVSRLPDNCALKRILDIQLLVKTSLSQVTAAQFQELYSADNAYIEDVLQKVTSLKKTLPAMPAEEATKWYMKTLNACERYMLGATALDCSLMVTFRKLAKDEVLGSNEVINKHLISVGNTRFMTQVKIMDLDPKATTHYDKMIKQFNASHVAYKSFLRNKLIE